MDKSIEVGLRCINYAYYQINNWVVTQFNRIDQRLQKPESSVVRIALAALFYFGSIFVSFALSWKWVVTAYALQTLLDVYVSPRPEGQRWDEIMLQGLNLGLAIRAATLVINGLMYLSFQPLAWGLFLGGTLFYKEDWDQYDWGSYVMPANHQKMADKHVQTLSIGNGISNATV